MLLDRQGVISSLPCHHRHNVLSAIISVACTTHTPPMDDFAAEMLATTHDEEDKQQQTPPSSSAAPASSSSAQHEPATPPPNYLAGSLRGGFAAIREKASLQDRLVEK